MANELNLNSTTVELDMDGTPLTLSTGKMAKQADGAVIAKMGDTQVLVTAVSNRDLRPGADFFPLTVNYEEKYYSAGRIPGGFFKREGRASTDATLSCRIIDRQIRPMFPDGYLYETQVIATVLSYDGKHDPAILGAIGTGAALSISDIPFNGPTASVTVGKVDGKLVLMPSSEDLEKSDLDLVVAGTDDASNMVEGGANFVPEAEMIDALEFGHNWIKKICATINDLQSKVGREKRAFEAVTPPADLLEQLDGKCRSDVVAAFKISDKQERSTKLDEIKSTAIESLTSGISDEQEKEDMQGHLKTFYKKLCSDVVREDVLNNGRRMDGRGLTDVRPISTEVDCLPVVHGSSLFTRGETQVLSVVTLGSKMDEQMIDGLAGTTYSNYMLHYNFPPYSTGEARMLRGQSRREIGHGMLAKRAIAPILPDPEDFPYTIRIVCEVLESNGSSSMGSVCSGVMALMDTGVPIKTPVAGIAMGLIDGGEKKAILSDILGDEDHLGDMDFKVTGSAEGITAIQMDLKIEGVTRDLLEKALNQARDGRLHILERMNSAISTPNSELKDTAPRIESFQIPKDKIRDIIGSGGKTIRSIIETTGAKVDVEDDGTVSVASSDKEALMKAKEMIIGIAEGPQEGKVYKGVVKRVVDFGAFVEVLPGVDGLLHISEISNERIQSVAEHISEGDEFEVKVLEVDRTGRIRLSRKVLLDKED